MVITDYKTATICHGQLTALPPKAFRLAASFPEAQHNAFYLLLFEILGITSGRDEFEAIPTKRYINPIQVNKNGTKTNGSKANTRATILLDAIPNDIYYLADNADGPLQILYARILIRYKHN